MSFIKLLRLFKIILFTFKDKIECYIRFLLSKMNKIEKPTKDIKLKKIFSIKLIPSPGVCQEKCVSNLKITKK